MSGDFTVLSHDELCSAQKTEWKDVVGMHELRNITQVMKKIVEGKHEKLRKELQVTFNKGLLLSGKPGTGKTMVAKVVARDIGYSLIIIPCGTLVSFIEGFGTNRLKTAFKEAEKIGRCILFFDEIDAIGKDRSKVRSKDSVIEFLLAKMLETGMSIFYMAATNRLEDLDPALIRSGRMDSILNFEDPGYDQIVDFYIKQLGVRPSEPNIDIALLSNASMGLSFADLKNVINKASEVAFMKEGSNKIESKELIRAIYNLKEGLDVTKNTNLKTEQTIRQCATLYLTHIIDNHKVAYGMYKRVFMHKISSSTFREKYLDIVSALFGIVAESRFFLDNNKQKNITINALEQLKILREELSALIDLHNSYDKHRVDKNEIFINIMSLCDKAYTQYDKEIAEYAEEMGQNLTIFLHKIDKNDSVRQSFLNLIS